MQSIEFNLKRFAPMIVLALMFSVQTSTQQNCVGQVHQEQIEDQYAEKRAERDRLWTAANEAKAAGKLPEAAQLGEQMLQVEKEWLGEQDAKLIASLNWLAGVYEQQEEWAKAIERQELAATYSREIHGDDDWQTGDARLAVSNLKQLSTLSQDQRDELERANQFHQESVSEYHSGNYAAAIKAATAARAIHEKILGEKHPDYATILNNLAELYRSMGDYARAERLHLKCKEIQQAMAS